MHNGDRLTGDLIRQEGSHLKLKTEYAGTLSIDWDQVREVRLDQAQEILLDDETVLSVMAITREDDRLRLRQEKSSEPMSVAADRIEVIEPEPWELGEGHKLSGRVNVSVKTERGNTHKNQVDIDYRLDYRRRVHRLFSWGELEFDTNTGNKTTDKWTLSNQYAHLFSKPWYASAWLLLQHDRFQDLRLRVLAGPGIGRLFDERPARNLRAEVGFFHWHDDFYVNEDEPYWGPGWSLDFDQLVWNERLQPYHKQYGLVATAGGAKTIWRSWTGLRVPLAGGLVGSLEYEVEYDSAPAFKTKTTDTTLRLKLGYQW